MLVLIVFWTALILALISWGGVVAEVDRSALSFVTVTLFLLAFLAAVVDGASWL